MAKYVVHRIAIKNPDINGRTLYLCNFGFWTLDLSIAKVFDSEAEAKTVADFHAASFVEMSQLEALKLIQSIKDALGTAEDGEALVEVARNAHKAEMELAYRKNMPYSDSEVEPIDTEKLNDPN